MSPCRWVRPLRRRRFPRMSGDEPQRLNLAAWDITFPRVSGDEPWTAEGAQKHTTFSPLERG